MQAINGASGMNNEIGELESTYRKWFNDGRMIIDEGIEENDELNKVIQKFLKEKLIKKVSAKNNITFYIKRTDEDIDIYEVLSYFRDAIKEKFSNFVGNKSKYLDGNR